MKLNRRQNAVIETLNQINNVILSEFEDMVVSEVEINRWNSNIWLESREFKISIRFTFTKRDIYVILYNTCGYVTREGYLLVKYSSKNRKKDIKTLLNMLLKDLIRIKSCKSK